MFKIAPNSHLTRRLSQRRLLGVVCVLLAVSASFAQQPQHQPAPIERRPQAPASPPANPYRGGPYPGQPTSPYGTNQGSGTTPQRQIQGQFRANPQNPDRTSPNQHLAQWMDAHRSLSLAQQQSALDSEPGFHQLNPQEQQRMHQRLTQLNNLPPQQQQRVIARTEALEKLAPAQRQQFRGAMAQLGSLPTDRRRAVARTFRTLSAMPEAQRQSYLNSPEYRTQFNDQEKSTMRNLLNVAPLIPTLQQP